MTTNINLLGHCEKCGHLVTWDVEVKLDDGSLTPCECPECHEGTVYFEKLAVHHKPGTAAATRLARPSKDTFKRVKRVFQWGMLTIGVYVLLACGIVLHYGRVLTPVWQYLLIGGFVLLLAALWLFLVKVFEKAGARDWVNAHGFLPTD